MSTQQTPESGARRARGRPRDWDDKTAQNTIKSLDRAMEVFEYLSEAQGKPLTALAAETGQSPATVYRILVTLEGRGLVEFDPEDQVTSVRAPLSSGRGSCGGRACWIARARSCGN